MSGVSGAMVANASAVASQTPSKMDPPEDVTTLRLIGFSIEVKTDPVTLLMQTDKGPFSVVIPKTELSNLVYALQIVSYADEPLRQKQLKREEARRLDAASGNTNEKKEIAPSMTRPSRNKKKGSKKSK
jgi:hypothetical protein